MSLRIADLCSLGYRDAVGVTMNFSLQMRFSTRSSAGGRPEQLTVDDSQTTAKRSVTQAECMALKRCQPNVSRQTLATELARHPRSMVADPSRLRAMPPDWWLLT